MTKTIPPVPPPIRTKIGYKKKSGHYISVRKPRKEKPKIYKPVRKEVSAGGVAVRKEGQDWLVAILKTEHKRGEVWVLPKGHVENNSGERISEAARREVEEEAGLKDLSVKNQLGVTKFNFQAEGVLIKKTVHYFLMITQQKKLIPQKEEHFIDAAWFSINEAMEKLEYDTDQDIVARARFILTGTPVPRKIPRKSVRQNVLRKI